MQNRTQTTHLVQVFMNAEPVPSPQSHCWKYSSPNFPICPFCLSTHRPVFSTPQSVPITTRACALVFLLCKNVDFILAKLYIDAYGELYFGPALPSCLAIDFSQYLNKYISLCVDSVGLLQLTFWWPIYDVTFINVNEQNCWQMFGHILESTMYLQPLYECLYLTLYKFLFR